MGKFVKRVVLPLCLAILLIANSVTAFAAAISGQVFAPGGTSPVTEPVEVVAVDQNNYGYQVETDSNGNYQFTDLQDNVDYQLYARLRPNSSYNYANSAKVSSSQSTSLNLTNATVTGYVYAPNGSMITSEPYIMVDVFNSSNNAFLYSVHASEYPGLEGQFNIGGLDPGSYYLKANYSGSQNYTQSFKTPVVISDPNIIQTVNMQLTAPTVTGSVYEYDGADVTQDCSVIVDSESSYYSFPVNNDGTYKCGGVPDGAYEIYARKNSSNVITRKLYVYIVDGQLQVIDLNFPDPSIHSVSGQVFNPDESAASGMTVVLSKDQDSCCFTTDASGYFQTGWLEDGTYSISVTGPDSSACILAQQYTVTVTNSVSSPVTIELALPQITGVVVDPDGNLMPNAGIDVCNMQRQWVAHTQTGFDGGFELGGLASGTYYVTAQGGNTAFMDSDSFMADLAQTPVYNNIQLTLTRTQIKGIILNTDGSSAQEGYVKLLKVNSTEYEPSYHTSSGCGGFKIGGLTDGTYKLRALSWQSLDVSFDSEIIVAGTSITINGQPYTAGQDYTLQLAAPQLSGTVVNPDQGNTPVSGSRVEISNANGEYIYDTQTRYDGTFGIGGLGDGSYIIRAHAPNESEYCDSMWYTITISGGAYTGTVPFIVQLSIPQITGMVADPDGNPVPYTGIDVCDIQRKWVAHTQTGLDGGFEIGGLAPGTYYVTAQSGNTDFMESDAYTVDLAQTPVYNNIQLVLTRPQITGIILNPDGSSAEQGYIDLKKVNSNEKEPTYRTNSGWGEFKIGGLTDGTYSLRALSWETLDISFASEIIVSGTTITINGQPYTAGQDHTLQLAVPQITGTVVTPAPGSTPVSGSRLDISDDDGQYIYTTGTRYDGTFGIGGLTDGNYRVRAYAPSESAYSNSSEYTITIADGAYTGTQPFIVELTTPQVVGRVLTPLSEGGAPVANAQVDIKESPDYWIPGVSTDENGYFKIGGLADGEYILRANQWNSEYTSSDEVVIVIENGQYIPGGTIDMYLALPQVEGTVRDPLGQLVSYGYVEVRETNGMCLEGNSIEGDGTFKLGGLQTGKEYIIKAYPDKSSSYTASSDMLITIPSDGSVLTVEMALTQPQVTGSVTDPLGNPVIEGRVEIQKKDDKMGYPGVDVMDGNFKLGGLEDGTYILTAQPNQDSDYSASNQVEITIAGGVFTEKDGQPYSGPVNLVLNVTQLSGSVIDADGNPVSKGWINIQTSENVWVFGVNVNENGTFKIGGLSDGTYYVTAYPDGGIEFTPSDETSITILDGVCTVSGQLVLQLNRPQLTGSVVSPYGDAQPDGNVDIRLPDGDGLKGVCVDYEGNFAIGGLEDGTYLLKAYPSWDCQYAASDEVEIQIVNGAYAGGELILQLKVPQVTGVVKNPDGSSAAYARVKVEEQYGKYVSEAETGEDGIFRIASLDASKSYIIKACPDWDSDFCDSDPVTITIDANGDYTGADITLTLTQTMITGNVLTPEGGTSQYGCIDIQKKNGDNTWEYIGETDVNELGGFRIKCLTDGIYKFRANPDWDSDYTAGESGEITVDSLVRQNGMTLNIILTNAQINGTVKDPTGSTNVGLGWVKVEKAIEADNWEWVGDSGVDYEGNFKIGGLADGTYRLKAYPDYSSPYTASEYSGSIIVSGGIANTSSIQLTLTQPYITGLVKDPSGAPVQNGWVEVRDSECNYITGAGIKEDGSFALGIVANGVYMIMAYPELGSSFMPSEEQTINVSGNVVNIILNLRNCQVSGTVEIPDGSAIFNKGWLELYSVTESRCVACTSIEGDGTFHFGGLPDGQYTIRAFAQIDSEYANSISYSFTITGGVADSNNIVINMTTAKLTGNVNGLDNNYTDSAWVKVGDSQQNWMFTVPVAADGSFKLPELAEGNYMIQAFQNIGEQGISSEVSLFHVDAGGNSASLTLQLILP